MPLFLHFNIVTTTIDLKTGILIPGVGVSFSFENMSSWNYRKFFIIIFDNIII